MIRANLLPRPKDSITLFGFSIDADYARQAAIGAALAICIGLVTIGIETTRLARLTNVADAYEIELASHQAARRSAERLALDIERLQALGSAAAAYRSSGTVVAARIARLGNAIPGNVWLDGVTQTSSGYDIDGDADAIAPLGRTILNLNHAFPEYATQIAGLNDRADSGMHFTATIARGAGGVDK